MTCGDCIHFRSNVGGLGTCSLPRAEDDGKGSDPSSEACKDFQMNVCSECKYRKLVNEMAALLTREVILQLRKEDREFLEAISWSTGRKGD